MKFFFPDSSDHVDPTYDFITETRSETKVRQRDDKYAHEILNTSPYDGILISKSIVEQGMSRYTEAQRLRLLRDGAPKFFRTVKPSGGSGPRKMPSVLFMPSADPPGCDQPLASKPLPW